MAALKAKAATDEVFQAKAEAAEAALRAKAAEALRVEAVSLIDQDEEDF